MAKLNPCAPVFVPLALRGKVTGAGAGAASVDPFELLSLPCEVVNHVASFLSAPRDVASAVLASKALAANIAQASLCLDLRSGAISSASTEEASSYKQRMLAGIAKHMPGTVGLLLPSSMGLEDEDVARLLAALPRLQLLDSGGERKLTHATAAAVARANAASLSRSPSADLLTPPLAAPAAAEDEAQGSAVTAQELEEGPEPEAAAAPPARLPARPLRVVNLQRCFQLHSGSLDELLAAPGVACLALSHLDLGRWPAPAAGAARSGAANGVAARPPSSLQILALNNCLRLHGGTIMAVAAAVGGSGGSTHAPDGGGGAIDPGGGAGGGARFLLLGGSVLALAAFVGGAEPPPPLPPRAAELLAASYKPWPTSTTTTVAAHLAAASYIVAAVLAMPRLEALELSFFPSPLVTCVRSVLGDPAATGRPEPVAVWEFAASAADVPVARRALLAALRASPPPPGAHGALAAGGRTADQLAEAAAAAALRCAVSCSSVTRATPLHAAAERGNAAGVADLLAAGANVDARDTGGATALFLAAFAGHTAVVERLLLARADVTIANAAGESPLYIAALRGHLGCVEALLQHCKARGVPWQHPDLYGDAWTPLHAAAVANRADVAACLLRAAGSAGAGELVAAPNKYGQTVVHIAARKGPAELLRMLLAAGGVAVVHRRDGSGDTPVEVAQKHRHAEALAEFRRLAGGRGGSAGGGGGGGGGAAATVVA